MISSETLRLYSHLIRFINWFYLFPSTWSNTENILIPIPRDSWKYLCWKTVSLGNIIFRLILLAIIGICIYMEPNPSSAILLGLIGSVNVLSTVFQLAGFMSNEHIAIINGLLTFNKKLDEYFKSELKANGRKTDGLENFLKSILIAQTTTVILSIPMTFLMLFKEMTTLHRFIVWFTQGHLFPNLFCSIFSGYMFGIDGMFVMATLFSTSIGMNSTTLWLRFNHEDPMTNIPDVKNKMRVFYRGHQIIVKLGSLKFSDVFLVAIIIVSSLMVTSLYCMIGLYNSMDTFSLACFAIIVLMSICTTKVIFEECCKITDTFMEYPNSLLRPRQHGIGTSKFEKSWARSCQPMYIRPGNMYNIDEGSFVTVLQKIIIDMTVNLLVSF